MKQDIAEFLVDSFIDYKGDEHKVVLCALSQTPEKSIDDDNLMVVWSNGYDVDETADICHEVLRTVSLGIAICCPADKKAFSEEIGKKIALNRAEKSIPKFVSLEPGVVNTTVVRAFLEQEMAFVKRCPEKFIKGYDEAKAHYNKKLNASTTASKRNIFIKYLEKFWQNINNKLRMVFILFTPTAIHFPFICFSPHIPISISFNTTTRHPKFIEVIIFI
jgi:hypothetical protein